MLDVCNYFFSMTVNFNRINKLCNYFCLVIAFVCFSFSSYAKDKAPEPVTWKKDLKEWIFGEDKIKDGSHLFSLDTPYRALDAAIVPISINFYQPQTEANYVKNLTLIVDENPSPVVSRFNFTPKMGNASITTRVRIDKYTYVRAVVEMNNGDKYMNAN